MTNVKVADLPPELREKLGYNAVADGAKRKTASASAWAKKTMASIQVPQIKQLELMWSKQGPSSLTRASLNSSQLMLLLGGPALLYFLLRFCDSLSCKNSGNPAGPMIWTPA